MIMRKNNLLSIHLLNKVQSLIIVGMKFWIGAAANLANISVIWAQLYIDKKCYGVHAYIVPLRDRKTH